MATAAVMNDAVCIMNKGSARFTFPLNKFTDREIECIKTGDMCAGCKTLPLNGFKGNKKMWCDLSRKIAVLEEEHIKE